MKDFSETRIFFLEAGVGLYRDRHELVYDQCRISGKKRELFTELFPQASETRSGYRNRSNTLILLRSELKNSS